MNMDEIMLTFLKYNDSNNERKKTANKANHSNSERKTNKQTNKQTKIYEQYIMKVKRSHQDEWEEVCHRKKEYVVENYTLHQTTNDNHGQIVVH
jgi:hypothetical protein